MKDNADIIYDGDDENDNVINTDTSYKRINFAKSLKSIEDMSLNTGLVVTVGTNDISQLDLGFVPVTGFNGTFANDSVAGTSSADIMKLLDGNDDVSAGAGNDEIDLGDGNDFVNAGSGNDIIRGGNGADFISSSDGDDTIVVGGTDKFDSGLAARNVSSMSQVGTNQKTSITGMLKVEDVIDGGKDFDTIQFGHGNIALFMHDAFSSFHSSVELSIDATGKLNNSRFNNVEQIIGNDSDLNLIDLTSPDYSLVGQTIKISGGDGVDIIWGSDANENILGDAGNDVLFGGAGTNILTGGSGADEFQFTKTSTKDRIEDFSIGEGDTLKFFNKGGAIFDKSSAALENGNLTIKYGSNLQDQLTVYVGNDELTISEISDAIIIA